MLQKLYVKNYALIDELELMLTDHLNIITGETGAGKSIILGALSLILGQRVNTAAISNNQEKCVIEGVFLVAPYNLKPFFEEHGLDYEDETVLRREVTPSGKSRAFVNDTPVTLDVLQTLSEQLVSLHAQHQTLHLHDTGYHLHIIDTLANHTPLLTQYAELFKSYRKNQNRLHELETNYAAVQKELDYTLFQLNELEEARLTDPREQEALEQELSRLNHAETIKQALLQGIYALDEQEASVLQQLRTVKNTLTDVSRYTQALEPLLERLDSLSIELQDISNELSLLESEVMMDPERAQEINDRLNIIYRLQKKHRLNTIAELLQLQQNLQAQVQSAENSDEEIKALKTAIAKQHAELLQLSGQMSANRKKQLPVFEQQINNLLAEVGMPGAMVKMAHTQTALTTNGIDNVEVMFAANKGLPPAEIRKVASGGELSRLMLCIQSLMADNTALPTLIFDEIDTGISGEVALKVGKVMQKLARGHQVICITHLPQIASKGNTHFFVYKQLNGNRTLTGIRRLQPQERVIEIAKMLSGDQPGQMAMANAKELLEG
ncbi:DNA repair protein RecN [Sphingobacteriales bacterium UPWRP_1]|nr:DNA repair protein RecN [Sphingobacteriales bacterium TSM_CSM]PSJ75375.1 DNA repair protein RecN [Sphingobacteriales bacterium UPWRP_1]